MDVAKFLSGFIGAGLSVFTANFVDSAKIHDLAGFVPAIGIGTLFLFLSLLLYLTTMCCYDSLLMPRRFWSESSAGTENRPRWIVARPPSSASWILYQNMLHVWQWQFIPATFFLVIGLFIIGTVIFVHALDPTAKSVPIVPILLLASALVTALSLPRRPKIVLAYQIKRMTGLFLFGKRYRDKAGLAVTAGSPTFWDCPNSSKLRYLFGPWLGSED